MGKVIDNQKYSKYLMIQFLFWYSLEPTPVNGINNLSGIEIDPKIDPESLTFPNFEGI